MRIYFRTSSSSRSIPFDYQHLLLGSLHKWIGYNDIHDKTSLYSLSWLSGGKSNGKSLDFPNGAEWFFSCVDANLSETLINGIKKDPDMFFGLQVEEIIIGGEQHFTDNERFLLASPVFVRKYDEAHAIHLTWDDPETDELLTATMRHKLAIAGLPQDISIKFDRTYHKAKTKLVTIKNIQSRANECPVIIKGTPEQINFAWNVGIGHSTGSGFGALK